MAGRTRTVGAVAAVCGLVSVGPMALVVAVDPDTAGQVAGITGSIAGLAGPAVSVHAPHRTPATQTPSPPPPTGGNGTCAAPVRPAGGTSAASERSAVVGGNIGEAVTGDGNHT
ncbi:hypothetical protein GCM10027168_42670 [Streptomyces capparidis]